MIRKARKEDAPEIAACLLLAMEEIVYEFIGVKDHQKAYDFMLHFVEKESNQYSFENCWVLQENEEVIGAINVYDGGKLTCLREPIQAFIETNYGIPFQPEDETEEGEYYIDSFGVLSNYQGKGYGAKLLQYVIDELVDKQGERVGLLVDRENPEAKKLYLKLGFKVMGEKILVGKVMEHLICCE
jgi:ribosomal protein S18 acetylase RimI-like enzyme